MIGFRGFGVWGLGRLGVGQGFRGSGFEEGWVRGLGFGV